MPAPSARRPALSLAQTLEATRVLVACPDARPPAYEAVAGLAAAGMLDRFVTSYYYDDRKALPTLARRGFPQRFAPLERRLRRRHHPAIPTRSVVADAGVDVALAVENRWPIGGLPSRAQIARWRTRRFDRRLARCLDRRRPDVALVFSDVASEFALPLCQQRGIATLLSMVHGDVREEAEVLAREAERCPEFFRIYLADGPVDARALAWLHDRRLRDLELADRVLVPSPHIAARLARHGTPPERIQVVPYAADTQRFRPRPDRSPSRSQCTFLFAGGITQRKGIKDLLEAWRMIRRPGWSLRLLGALPADPRPLEPFRDEVEWLGRVGHAEVPAAMAAADVFVFPSLFEGSAVVTYEAMACGLPLIVTAAAGSVARDGREGRIVPAADANTLAAAMESLGLDPEGRHQLGVQARIRAEEFTWARYQASVAHAVGQLTSR